MGKCEDKDGEFHFLFLFFKAFHSPSCEAKLPISSFTFLFLSASLRKRKTTTRDLQFRILSQSKISRLRKKQCLLASSRHILTCPWPPSASRWPGSASPSWSPSGRPCAPAWTCAWDAPSPSPALCCRASSHSPTCRSRDKGLNERNFLARPPSRQSPSAACTYTSTVLGVRSFRGIGFFLSNTRRGCAEGASLMVSRISLWSSCREEWDHQQTHTRTHTEHGLYYHHLIINA